MTTAIRRRRGTTTQHATFTGLEGEVTVDTTKDTLVVHDGSTAGGHPLAKENNATLTGNVTVSGGTANGVAYLNGSKVLTTGSALTFDGTNLGVGVTPSAWSSFTGLQVGPSGSVSNSGTGTPVSAFSNNAYYNGTSWVYINTAAAAQYQLSTSQHIWRYAASGSGNITWSEAMRLDTSGNLGIGTSSPSSAYSGAARVAMVAATSTNAASLRLSSANASAELYSAGTSTEWGLYSASNSPFKIWTNNNVAATLDSSGNLGIGTSSPGTKLQVYGTAVATQISIDGTGRYKYFEAYASGTRRFYSGWDETSLAANLFTDGAHPITFGTNATERARITSGGNLLVGTTSLLSSNYRIQVVGETSGNGFYYQNTTNGGNAALFVNASGSSVGSINVAAASTAYNTSSDYRLKDNIAPMTGALAKVAALKPVTYKWKADGSDGEGFIAHELAEVVPQCVTGEKDAVDKEGKPVYQGIDTSFLVATLTAAIQEQQTLIEQLTARVAQLEGQQS